MHEEENGHCGQGNYNLLGTHKLQKIYRHWFINFWGRPKNSEAYLQHIRTLQKCILCM